MVNGYELSDTWFVNWMPVISEIIGAIWIDNGCFHWSVLPFAGGLYDQEMINGLTMDVWNYTANCYIEEIKLKNKYESERIGLTDE